MQRFLAFFRRFQVLLFFMLLQGVALSVYFTFSTFPRSQYLTTASEVSGTVLSIRNDITKHFNLSRSNEDLQAENLRLRQQLLENKLYLGDYSKMDSIIVKESGLVQRFEFIPGKVINSTHDKRNNYFTLNIGSSHGVKRGMGVMSDNGIVGVIHNTSSHFSVVKSCLTENINISVMIESTGEPGLLKWDGRNARIGNMTGVSNDTKIKKWSKVITRGSAGTFPRGIDVGKVYATEVVEGQPLWDVQVKFSENYRTLQYVYVIKNLLKEEQEKLEAKIPADPEE